jgi:hypothetical protein
VLKQLAVLNAIQAAVIERLASVFAYYFATSRPAGEKQCRIRGRVFSENGKHAALMFWRKVEETVPCGDPVKLLVQAKFPHVGNDPILRWKSLLADVDERRRRVNASDWVPLLIEETGNWFGLPTPDIED